MNRLLAHKFHSIHVMSQFLLLYFCLIQYVRYLIYKFVIFFNTPKRTSTSTTNERLEKRVTTF